MLAVDHAFLLEREPNKYKKLAWTPQAGVRLHEAKPSGHPGDNCKQRSTCLEAIYSLWHGVSLAPFGPRSSRAADLDNGFSGFLEQTESREQPTLTLCLAGNSASRSFGVIRWLARATHAVAGLAICKRKPWSSSAMYNHFSYRRLESWPVGWAVEDREVQRAC